MDGVLDVKRPSLPGGAAIDADASHRRGEAPRLEERPEERGPAPADAGRKLPVALGFALYGADGARLLLGEQWISAAPIVQILAIAALFRAEASKILVIIAQLWLVLTAYKEVVAVAFIATFVITVLLFRLALLDRN